MKPIVVPFHACMNAWEKRVDYYTETFTLRSSRSLLRSGVSIPLRSCARGENAPWLCTLSLISIVLRRLLLIEECAPRERPDTPVTRTRFGIRNESTSF